jgi:uncharacterized repeat protein (TIGR03803 family)
MQQGKNRRAAFVATLLACAVTLACGSQLSAQSTYRVIHNFNPNGDGWGPDDTVVMDANGNLFGTTTYGGNYPQLCFPNGCGIVFELSPNRDGSWTENILHGFQGSDGANPFNRVVLDTRGNLYGVAPAYGLNNYGNVFELAPAGNSRWTFSTLYSFRGKSDGGYNYLNLIGGVALGSDGHLYGVTPYYGAYGQGVVFDLSRASARSWYEVVAHAFKVALSPVGSDGSMPEYPPIMSSDGNLYGTTYTGGTTGLGTVYALTPNQHGIGSTENILHSFQGGLDGGLPAGTEIFDAAGNLYGTTLEGGQGDSGTVFKLAPNGDGSWTKSVIYSFQAGGIDGDLPSGALAFDQAGNLYGTTRSGGQNGQGTVYKLAPSRGNQWIETILHTFSGSDDGGGPEGGVILDNSGNIYGTAFQGGSSPFEQGGVVFEITP